MILSCQAINLMSQGFTLRLHLSDHTSVSLISNLWLLNHLLPDLIAWLLNLSLILLTHLAHLIILGFDDFGDLIITYLLMMLDLYVFGLVVLLDLLLNISLNASYTLRHLFTQPMLQILNLLSMLGLQLLHLVHMFKLLHFQIWLDHLYSHPLLTLNSLSLWVHLVEMGCRRIVSQLLDLWHQLIILISQLSELTFMLFS